MSIMVHSTLLSLEWSADNLCKQNVEPDLDPNCLTLRWYSEKVDFERNQQSIKSMKNYPVDKELSHYLKHF